MLRRHVDGAGQPLVRGLVGEVDQVQDRLGHLLLGAATRRDLTRAGRDRALDAADRVVLRVGEPAVLGVGRQPGQGEGQQRQRVTGAGVVDQPLHETVLEGQVGAAGRLADHLRQVGARQRRDVQHGRRDRHGELAGLGGHLVPHVGARGHHDAERRRGGAAGGERLEEGLPLHRRGHRDQLLGLVHHDQHLGLGRALAGLAQLADVVGHPARAGEQLLAAVRVEVGAVQLGGVRERQRHLGQGHVRRRPRVGDHPVRRDPESRHQTGPDQRGLAAAGRTEHRDDGALAAAARAGRRAGGAGRSGDLGRRTPRRTTRRRRAARGTASGTRPTAPPGRGRGR